MFESYFIDTGRGGEVDAAAERAPGGHKGAKEGLVV